jgi:hypothetical protein
VTGDVVMFAATGSGANRHSDQVVETEQKLVGVLLASVSDEGRELVTQSMPVTRGTERLLVADDMSGSSDQENRRRLARRQTEASNARPS